MCILFPMIPLDSCDRKHIVTAKQVITLPTCDIMQGCQKEPEAAAMRRLLGVYVPASIT